MEMKTRGTHAGLNYARRDGGNCASLQHVRCFGRTFLDSVTGSPDALFNAVPGLFNHVAGTTRGVINCLCRAVSSFFVPFTVA
jgi:hypothetical protein